MAATAVGSVNGNGEVKNVTVTFSQQESMAKANAIQEKIEGLDRMTLSLMVECGGYLVEAVKGIKKGDKKDYIVKNFRGSYETANRYMRLARHHDLIKGCETQAEALATIAKSKTRKPKQVKLPKDTLTNEGTDLEVVEGQAGWSVCQSDALDYLGHLHATGYKVDLTLFSPPYPGRRQYGELNFDLEGEEYVKWQVKTIKAALRVTRGAVVCVVEGQLQDYDWDATPALVLADLKRDPEVKIGLRRPLIYRRTGIPGSGHREWFRHDYELCLVFTNTGKLPWSDPIACGRPPKVSKTWKSGNRKPDGTREDRTHYSPAVANPGDVIQQTYTAKEVAKLLAPYESGDVIDCVTGRQMGSSLSGENEAPHPERLYEFLVKSLCPPGGVVLDCFCGSGTTLAVAVRNGRRALGCDLREGQVELTRRRVLDALGKPVGDKVAVVEGGKEVA
jgi:hypothetical protein